MKPADLDRVEHRLRRGYADAAATVGPDDISPGPPGRPAAAGSDRASPAVRGHRRLTVAVAAAVAMLLIAAALAVLIPVALRSQHRTASQGPARSPRYLATVMVTFGKGSPIQLDIRSAATGKVLARVKPPQPGGAWLSVTAEGGQAFIASESVQRRRVGDCSGYLLSYFYRLQVSSRGQPTSLARLPIGPVHGVVTDSAITPDGRTLGYIYQTASCANRFAVTMADLGTGRPVGSWREHDLISGGPTTNTLSMAASGDAMSLSRAWAASNGATVVREVSVLRPGMSGRPLRDLGVVLRQTGPARLSSIGPVTLSRDGRTLYDLAQTGTRPFTVAVTAIDVATRIRMAALHSWRASGSDYAHSVIVLDPSGRYLLVLLGNKLAMIDLSTRKYTPLAARLPLLAGPHMQAILLSLAW